MSSQTVEFIRNETGKLTSILVNGKAVKGSSVRGYRKAETSPVFAEYLQTMKATNPFTGVEVELTPLEATIYAFCTRWYQKYSFGDMVAPIQTYDDMKYFLLEINEQAYFDLLD